MSDIFASGFVSEGNPAMVLALVVILVWAISAGILEALLSSQYVIIVFAGVLFASLASSGLN